MGLSSLPLPPSIIDALFHLFCAATAAFFSPGNFSCGTQSLSLFSDAADASVEHQAGYDGVEKRDVRLTLSPGEVASCRLGTSGGIILCSSRSPEAVLSQQRANERPLTFPLGFDLGKEVGRLLECGIFAIPCLIHVVRAHTTQGRARKVDGDRLRACARRYIVGWLLLQG